MDLNEVSPGLVEELRHLGDEYGPLGVALAAAQLTDPEVLVRELTMQREKPQDEEAPRPVRDGEW